MSMPKLKPHFTVDQYLAIERAAEERHIFLDGEIHSMAGVSDAHGDITTNALGILYNQLKGTPCRARIKDTKVRSGTTPLLGHGTAGMFSYPDIVVVCDEIEYHDSVKDIVLNPTAILEVLSPATEAFDRGEKFLRYQTWNATLREYVLVSQEQPQIEVFRRQADDTWSYQRFSGLQAEASLPSIHCTLKLKDVYDRVVFPQAR